MFYTIKGCVAIGCLTVQDGKVKYTKIRVDLSIVELSKIDIHRHRKDFAVAFITNDPEHRRHMQEFWERNGVKYKVVDSFDEAVYFVKQYLSDYSPNPILSLISLNAIKDFND